MHEPVTKLDTRYSEQDGVVTPWEETRHVLAHSHGVLALCIHVLAGPVHHHVARFGGARRGETIPSTQPARLLFKKRSQYQRPPPLVFFNMPMYTTRSNVLVLQL
jgi:hypothetical protein